VTLRIRLASKRFATWIGSYDQEFGTDSQGAFLLFSYMAHTLGRPGHRSPIYMRRAKSLDDIATMLSTTFDTPGDKGSSNDH